MFHFLIVSSINKTFTFYCINNNIIEISALGMGMGMSSYQLALNTYFVKNRNKATGISLTITGLGPILMPQLFSFLIANYTAQHAVIIVSGLCLHSFISASLLQPIKWHLKEEIVNIEQNGTVSNENVNNKNDTEINVENSKNNLLKQQGKN